MQEIYVSLEPLFVCVYVYVICNCVCMLVYICIYIYRKSLEIVLQRLEEADQ
jgi:hypothetical protein